MGSCFSFSKTFGYLNSLTYENENNIAHTPIIEIHDQNINYECCNFSPKSSSSSSNSSINEWNNYDFKRS